MKNSLLAMASAILITAACSQQPAKHNDLDKYGLVCPVKSIMINGDDGTSIDVKFNRLAQVERAKQFSASGKLVLDKKYSYDSQHNLIQIWPIGEDGQETGRLEFEYVGDQISKYIAINMNNQEIKRWEYTYDGERIIRTDCFEENELAYVTTNTYDGDTYFQVLMDAEGDTLNVGYLKDMSANKPLFAHSEDFSFEIEYNEKALPIKSTGTVVDSDGTLYWNDILDETGYAAYEYEYDSKGNWTTRRLFFGDERIPGEVTTRKIRY